MMARLRLEHLFFLGLVILALALILTEPVTGGALIGQASPAAEEPAVGTEVQRIVLAETEPDAAPGEVLELVRYVIPPNVTLPAHTHPGPQLNVIESGSLTYYVVADGEVTVNRVDGTTEHVGPGESTILNEGDALIEPAGVEHYGANDTWRPVTILTATLLDENAPPSILATPVAR